MLRFPPAVYGGGLSLHPFNLLTDVSQGMQNSFVEMWIGCFVYWLVWAQKNLDFRAGSAHQLITHQRLLNAIKSMRNSY